MTSSVDILNVEQAAKAMLEKGIDGIYLCTLDELHDFVTHVITLEERKKQKDLKLVNF